MTETMKDYEKELETSLKQIEEGDLLTGTVVNVTDKEVMLDLKAYAEGVIRLEDYSREPDFRAHAKEIEEETYELPKAGEATTSLGSLFANIKLDE